MNAPTPAVTEPVVPPALSKRFKTNDERLLGLEQRIALTITDRSLALRAITHKSYCNEHKDEPLEDNERLEYLGDAVVDLAIGHRLMDRFPKANEGELSKLRALIVNEEGLGRIGRALSLGDVLLLGRGEELTGGRDKTSLVADTLEAVIGALFLSDGMPAVMGFIDRVFAEALEGVAEGRQGQDNKSVLQETSQSLYKASPRYRVVGETGPDHEKIFEVEVSIGAEILARSTGRSKKEAEQAAAKDALQALSTRTVTPAPADGTA
ncbi:MAG: ribonuclease III [Myxococcales bacterium]|nr:ribonuclease III [Myxococcales bacterium]